MFSYFILLLFIAQMQGKVQLLNDTTDVVLRCPVQSDSIRWLRNNQSLDGMVGYEVDGDKVSFVYSRTTLGLYSCFTVEHGERTIEVSSPPIMEGDSMQSKNAINDETFVFECKGFGHPRPVVLWWRGNQSLNIDDLDAEDPRVTVRNSSDMDFAILKIKRVQDSDGGEYTCQATNQHGSAEMKLKVAIKDKYAALWPFAGIVVEVVVLCAIILLVEKRRKKKEEKEVLVHAADDKGSPDGKEGEELRQRK